MSRGSDHFHQLVNELDQLLKAPAAVDPEQSVRWAQRREELERELISLLRPDTFSGVEARHSVRVPCHLGGKLRTSAERRSVIVTNLSCGGAGLALEAPIAAGVEVELEFLAGSGSGGELISRFGHIAWAAGNTAGVGFEPGTEPLDQRMLRFVLDLIRKR